MTTPVPALAAALADRYRIERELGAGGMATVYLAHDVRHDRKVALKVMRPELAAAIGAQRFLAEIRTTANLQHPHILPLHDSGAVNGGIYYVMPFVEGESLRDRLEREKQLPIDDAIRIARDVAGALDYAHRHGVIHRDIKPENILLHDGTALVADFGIALAASKTGDARLTETGMSFGTPAYMSPEQAMGERSLDARSDVYALGCVLYEMLAGAPPFAGPTAQAIVAKVITAEAPPLRSVRRSVPPHVESAVGAALEKLPADRIGSAREFAAALDPAAGAAPSRRRRGTEVGGSRHVVRHPAVIALAALALLATALAAWQFRPAREAPQARATVRFAIDPPSDVQLDIYALSGPSLSLAPDGSAVAFMAQDAEGTRRIFVRRVDALEARALRGTEGASHPLFSPDGRWIAYLAGPRLFRIAVDGGAPQAIATVSDVRGLTWTVSGTIILAARGALHSVPVAGGTLALLAPPDTARGELLKRDPMALADGEHVLYSSWSDGGADRVKIGVLSLSSRRSVTLDLNGVSALGMIDDYVLYANTNNDILAARVDLARGRVLDDPVPVASGIRIGAAGSPKAVLSRSGTLVYLGGALASRAVLADRRGGTVSILDDVRAYGYPRFSPDGRRIAITIGSGPTSDVWLYDLASRTPTRLTSGGSQNERPEWTPDGARVLFRSDRTPRSSIWWQPADHSGPATPLIAGGTGSYYEAVITPDGRHVVFQSDTTGADIEYRAVVGDTVVRPIATTRAAETMARISPDGRWIAFVTDEGGTLQVVVQPFPGPGPRVQVSVAGGTEPVWARDGRTLYYRGGGAFIAASVATTSPFTVTTRTRLMDDRFERALSPHANYDVAPDGTSLLVLDGAGSDRLIAVHNWADEVRAQLRSLTAGRQDR